MVVGAGLAGLVAARELVAAGRDVVVLEARDRVGGRLLNHPIGGGSSIEVGGQWIGPTQDRIAALADELGVETYPTYTTGDHLLVMDGKTTRFAGEFPPFEPDTLNDLANALIALETMAADVPVDAPWDAPKAEAWDAITLRSWMDETCKDDGAKAMLELVAGAVFTANSAELSLLHVLFYIASAGNLSPLLTDVEGGAQERRFVGGSQVICDRMAEGLGDRVHLDAPVRRIDRTDGVVVSTDGDRFEAAACVVAVPPTVVDRITFAPALPGHRAQLQRRMAGGSVIKCHAIYERPFWRDDGLSGRIVDPSGSLMITFDNSLPDDDRGILMGFLEADEARRLARVDPRTRRREVLDCLARHFGPLAAEPVDYVDRVWDDEEWTLGCYGANLPPGGWTRFGHAIREPVGPIHWASAETGTRWVNYMDGAVESGQRAAQEILES